VSLFCCPVCGAPLERTERTLRCPAGHSYDLAKEGYAYLLPPNRKHSASPGDDRGMAAARRAFLSGGWYEPLRNALCALILARADAAPAILDAGCGEGYYTSGIRRALLDGGKAPVMAGIDISKGCLRAAARRERNVEFAVASSYSLPLADASADCLLNCFSPLALDEFRRVLRPGGTFFYVVPAAEHLWELKEVLYDRPYRNEEKETPYEGFSYEDIVPVDGRMQLPGRTEVENLFQMTPYFWKTPKEGAARLAALDGLDVRFSFRIHVFRRL